MIYEQGVEVATRLELEYDKWFHLVGTYDGTRELLHRQCAGEAARAQA